MSTTAFDPDLLGSASHRHMAAHLTAPFAGGAGDTAVPIDATGLATVAWTAREPLVLVAPRQTLDLDALVVTARLTGAAADLPALTFAAYTEAGAFLPLYRPPVNAATRRAQPFSLELTVAGVNDAARIAALLELTLVEGVLGRMLYVLGAEKQRIRREGREVAAARLLARAHDHALDSMGADLGVPRFTDVIEYDAAAKQIVSRARKEPDGREPDVEYRRRLAPYRGLLVPTPGRVDELLNGSGTAQDPNRGPLHDLDPTFTSRFAIAEQPSPFAVAVHLVGTGGPARKNFLDYVRKAHLVWPANTAAGNDAHSARLLPREAKQRQDALRSSMRGAYSFEQAAKKDPAFAPLLAEAFDRAARCRDALKSRAKWRITRAQKGDAGSRYELGLGADLKIPTNLETLATAVGQANRKPAQDPEIEALIRSMTPRSTTDDPEGRWFLEPCGFRTVQRIDQSTLYVSHLPVLGLVIDGPDAVTVPGWAEIVPGSFGTELGTEFLAYDRLNGTGQFYTTRGHGEFMTLGPLKTGWSKTWSTIVAGQFGGDSGGDDLLFYDREAGKAVFYRVDFTTYDLVELSSATDWRTTWQEIVPGDFLGGTHFTDLARYDPENGELEFVTANARNVRPLGTVNGVRRTWSHVVGGPLIDSGHSDLLFYDRSAGLGEIYTLDEPAKLRLLETYPEWGRRWSHIRHGMYEGVGNGLLFYDRDTGAAEAHTLDDVGQALFARPVAAPAGWTHLVGREWEGDGKTSFVTYDRRLETAGFVRLRIEQVSGGVQLKAEQFGELKPSAPPPQPPAFKAHFYAAESQGSHVVLAEGLGAADAVWKAGHEAWTLLSKTDAATAWAAATKNEGARQAFFDAGLPDVADPTQLAAQLGALPPDLLDTIKLGPNLAGSVTAGGGLPELTALVETLRAHDLSSALGFVAGTDAYVVVAVTPLPLAGLNLAERRTSGFRWYGVPLAGLRALVSPSGAVSTLTPVDEGLTALVLLGYVRRGGVPDPYQFRVDLPQGAQLTLLQYEFLMNLLALAHPAGVGVETYTLRQRHVALGGTVAPLPPNISRTYRPFRRTRSRGEVATTLPPAPATTTGPRSTSLGGWVNGLSLASNKDGRLEIFTRGAQRDLSHLAETSNGWGPWGSLGRPSASVQVTGEPAAGVNADGRIEVFVRGSDGALWHIWQTAPNGPWSGWASLAGQVRDRIVVANGANGALEVFAQQPTDELAHIGQTTAGGAWGNWASLGGKAPDLVAAGRNADGRLEAFVRGTDDAVWHSWQTAPNGAWTPGWTSLAGTAVNVLALSASKDGRFELFTGSDDDTLAHTWQTAPSNGWSGWRTEGGVVGHVLAVAANQDGSLELFASGTDNSVSHLRQSAPSGGWNPWAPLGGIVSDYMAAGLRRDGRMSLFVRGADDGLWHITQTAPNGGWI